MDIKKVDDKPMVIHTKQKSKLHLHEKKAAVKDTMLACIKLARM